MLLSLLVLTTGLFLYTVVDRHHLFRHLLSHHNLRLFNSAQAWIDHGFWRLGGLLTFDEGRYDPAFPKLLYQSHRPFYVLPHLLALRGRGEHGFWGWVGTVPVAAAFLMATAMGVIAAMTVERTSLAAAVRPGRQAALEKLAFVAGFVVTFPQETLWSLAWNSFDGSYSLIAFGLAAAFLAAADRHPRLVPAARLGLYLSALLCARFGMVLALTILLVHWGNRRPGGATAAVVRPRTALVCLLLGLSHYLHLALAQALTGVPLRGADLLYRMGLTDKIARTAQSDIDYVSLLQAFTFAWRQSEEAIGKLPVWVNGEHLLFHLLGLGVFAAVLLRSWRRPARPLLELLILPPLIWSIGLNQSASEHPDLIGLLWLPAVALGLTFAVLALHRHLSSLGARPALYAALASLYLLFLWQTQYLLRAYPQLH